VVRPTGKPTPWLAADWIFSRAINAKCAICHAVAATIYDDKNVFPVLGCFVRGYMFKGQDKEKLSAICKQ